MTNSVKEILASELSHKNQVAMITEKVISDSNLAAQVIELLQKGSDVEKGTAAEVVKFASKESPEIMIPYIDVIIGFIDYKAPRVKWGCPESIGNLAKYYPDKVEKAIPKLLENLKDKSVVVRWCAAYALTEIAKYNMGNQENLLAKFRDLIKTEDNNGVKNVYMKTIKEIEKKTSPEIN